MARKIIISHVFPPIPDRRWDWCAYLDGDDERPHLYGWGTTKTEALIDLARVHNEAREAKEEANEH